MVKLASVSSMWMGSGSPSRASGAASPSSASSSQASPVCVEKKISCPTVTMRPSCLAAQRCMWRISSARRKSSAVTMRLPGPRLMGLRGAAMEHFIKLFGDLLVFVYHCFDRIVIHGYLSGLSRPEQVAYFFRQVVGVPVIGKEVLSRRSADYQNWVEAFARNRDIPIEWAEKGVRKEDHVRPWLRQMVRKGAYGVYFIFKSMEQGPTFRIAVPKFPTRDPNHRILAHQKSRFTHNYFYIRDEVLGPMVMRVATFFPFQTTYYLNGHSFIEQELNRARIGFRKN